MSDSQQSIDESEDATLYVVDPDDYRETKKIEAIHNAKEYVREVRQNEPGMATSTEWNEYHARLANAVADFGSELLPLIEDAIESDVLTRDDLVITTPTIEELDIREFTALCGRIRDDEKQELETAQPATSMTVYRQLERILRKLGLGLDIEEDTEPAEI